VCVGYVAVPLLSLLARIGALPPTIEKGAPLPTGTFKTLSEARRRASGPVCLFPEATTSNGRAVLKFGEGVIAEEVGKEGAVWIKYIR
jgi:1-acyl-sn-glycerol-3-phosphate acyltransferase